MQRLLFTALACLISVNAYPNVVPSFTVDATEGAQGMGFIVNFTNTTINNDETCGFQTEYIWGVDNGTEGVDWIFINGTSWYSNDISIEFINQGCYNFSLFAIDCNESAVSTPTEIKIAGPIEIFAEYSTEISNCNSDPFEVFWQMASNNNNIINFNMFLDGNPLYSNSYSGLSSCIQPGSILFANTQNIEYLNPGIHELIIEVQGDLFPYPTIILETFEICECDNCGICNGPGEIYECGCEDIPEGDCDCNGSQLDAIGECGGDCLADEDEDGICDIEDDCVGQYDDCGVCNGPGAIYECGCSDIPDGDCDCNGTPYTTLVVDCDCEQLYPSTFTVYETLVDHDNCLITEDCYCECYNDFDGDGVCDENEIVGCTDSSACNYSSVATDHSNTCIFVGDPCDDLNPLTFEDYVDEECFCGGIEIINVNELESLQVRIYPNPSSNNLTIDLGDLTGGNITTKLYDISNKLVFKKQSTSTLHIDVSNYAKGLYTIELSNHDKVLKSQLIIE